MVIILKRRLIDELMTTYLPTILILTIVYATNFFKPFFFEVLIINRENIYYKYVNWTNKRRP